MNAAEHFPREAYPAATSCERHGLAVPLIDATYIDECTDVMRALRHAKRSDLVQQLVAHCERQQKQCPGLSGEQLLKQLSGAVANHELQLSSAEVDWCMRQVSASRAEKK